MSTLAFGPAADRGRPLFATGLAVGVHLLLAALLLWGFRWHIPAPKPVQVELWSAPARQAAQPPVPRPPVPVQERPAEPPRPETPPAEINRRTEEKVKPPLAKVREKAEDKPVPRAPPVTEQPARRTERQLPQPTAEDEIPGRTDERATTRGQAGADTSGLLETYTQQVARHLQSKVVIQEPPGNPVATFRITVLASMTIKEHTLVRPSGDPRWDEAAEKALLLGRQLPPLPSGLNYGPELRTMKINLCPKSCP